MNRDTKHAWEYHDRTKHSWQSVRESQHALDWPNQPRPFKVYSNVQPTVKLEQPEQRAGLTALEAIAQHIEPIEAAIPDLEALSRLLYYALGITRKRSYPGGEIQFRAASCTGALYQFEAYLACGDLRGLPAGLYHFSPADMGLRLLRAGDFRDVLLRATARNAAVAHAPVSIVFTGTYWRNAWKYQARAYRHFGWDNGTILANLLAEATSLRLPAEVLMGFVDAEVNRLLDVDAGREVAFSIVPVGYADPTLPPAPPGLPPLNLPVAPLSHHEVDYPEMTAMHEASSLNTWEEVREWCEAQVTQEPERAGELSSGEVIPLRPMPDEYAGRKSSVEATVLARGSTRVFAREPITFEQLSTVLDASTHGFPADFHQTEETLWTHLYIVVNAVEGLQPGAYYYRRDLGALETLQLGNFRQQAGYLGLEQRIPADCSAAVFMLADLEAIFRAYGNRGYRAAQLEAGVVGGRIYLGAYSLGLGASGLTFYDDAVVEFFSPHARGKSAMFLMAVGKKLRVKS